MQLPNSLSDVDEEQDKRQPYRHPTMISPGGLVAGGHGSGSGGQRSPSVLSASPPPLGAVNVLPLDLDLSPSPLEPRLTISADNGDATRSEVATPVIPPRLRLFDGSPIGNGGADAAAASVPPSAAPAAAAAAYYSPAGPGSADSSPGHTHRRRGSVTGGPSPGFARRLSRGLSRRTSLLKSKLAESWPGSHHIRRLFRLFDTDQNGTLSPAELRAGLTSLGFDVSSASHMALLSKELDKDGTGVIRESQFIHVFRSLNRATIEAKLRAGAAAAAQAKKGGQPDNANTRIQLVKFEPRVQLEHPQSHELGVNFTRRDIPIDQLADVLRAEEEEEEEQQNGGDDSDAEGAEGGGGGSGGPTIRWLDICGFHEGVLDLVSNFFLLPHEMLGDEIELETAAHADFYSDRPNPTAMSKRARGSRSSSSASTPPAAAAAAASPGTGTGDVKPSNAGNRPSAAASAASSTRPHVYSSRADPPASRRPYPTSAPPNRRNTHLDGSHDGGGGDDSDVETLQRQQQQQQQAPNMQRTASQLRRSDSVGDAPPSNCTLKLLVHSIQMRNFPLVDSGDDGDERTLVSKKQYVKAKPYLQSTPVHIVVANVHTLITVRPWVEPTAKPGSAEEAEEPNRMFDDLIHSLSDTDPTSSSSVLGLSSSLQLLMRVWEDIADANWSVRDLMKEWKVYLGDHVDDIAGSFHTMQLNDFDRLASSLVRLYKPLVATTAALSEQEAQHATLSSRSINAVSPHSVRSMAQASARSTFLLPINPALRLLHRAVLRQYEQAALSLQLVKVLQEQFIQRGRDKSSDTLYLLTVVTTIVTPLQIATGVYGMNFDHFPELHYQNAYFWFWGINAVIITLIGLGFHFKRVL